MVDRVSVGESRGFGPIRSFARSVHDERQMCAKSRFLVLNK